MKKNTKAFVSTLSFTIYGTTDIQKNNNPVVTARMIRNHIIARLEEAVAKGWIKRFEYSFEFDALKRSRDILRKSKNTNLVKEGEEI